ncbi:MAG: efflux RND transporter periplasmic adaptor subunit [Lentimicrobium sp.]
MKIYLTGLGIIALFLFGCGGETKEPAKIVRPVKVAKVTSVSSSSKSYSGIVIAEQLSNLTFKVSGTIIEMKVDEGQNLRPGQLIAVLDPRDLELQLEAARASYQTAKSKIERNERLLAKQAISQQEFEMARAEYTNAKAKFENAENTLSDTKLLAPFAGFVEKKHVENYQKIQAGEPIIKLVNPNLVNVKFTLPESGINLLRSMTSMQVEFETLKGKKFEAKVKEYVDASPDGSGIPVTVVITDPTFSEFKNQVSTGFSCSITINTPGPSGENQVIAIPVNAVFGDVKTNQKSVWIYNASSKTVSRKSIELGQLLSNKDVEVKSGLTGGETIVVAGVNNIYEGEQVNILEN